MAEPGVKQSVGVTVVRVEGGRSFGAGEGDRANELPCERIVQKDADKSVGSVDRGDL